MSPRRRVPRECRFDSGVPLPVSPELPRKEKTMGDTAETAILAGGCYWIMQQLLGHPDGVISTRAGWTGGEGDNPTEENPQGHAEAVEVIFDPDRISYRGVLEYFLHVHRADLGERIVGSIYRSAIFCTTDEQHKMAKETISDVEAAGHWPGRIVTEISDAGPFWEAEDQGYLQRYPEGCIPFPRRGVVPASRETAVSSAESGYR